MGSESKMGSIRRSAVGKASSLPSLLAPAMLAALCLTLPAATAAHALTPRELFEKIIPRVKQPVRHRLAAKPRTIRPAVEPAKAEATPPTAPVPKAKPDQAAAELPVVEPATVPLPRSNPKTASAGLAPDAVAPGAEPPDIANLPAASSAPAATRVQTTRIVPAERLAGSALAPPGPSAEKTDRLKPATDISMADADRIERARQATAMMAGAPAPTIDFQQLAFAPPMLATPLGPAPAVSAPVIPVAPVPASAASGLPADLTPTPRRKPVIVPAALSMPIRPALPESLAACSASMSGLKISAVSMPPLRAGSCGAPDPYVLKALDEGAVTLLPAATTNCEMATQLAHWLDDKVQPAAISKLGGRVTGLRVADSYSCRSRDGIPGEQLSEHAFMNAVDIAAFQVNGKWVDVENKPGRTDSEQAFLDQARAGACDEFMTVLGPGSDSYHANHFHLDMRHRGRHGDSRYCH